MVSPEVKYYPQVYLLLERTSHVVHRCSSLGVLRVCAPSFRGVVEIVLCQKSKQNKNFSGNIFGSKALRTAGKLNEL